MCDLAKLSRRPRLLLMAYACSPYRGSEPGIGWNRAVEAAKYCDTWVICEGHEYAADLQRYQREHDPIEGLHFVCVAKPSWARWLARLPFGFYTSYNLWQRRAFRKARELHAQMQFDLAHQATIIGYREPGYAWRLGVPFIWGPIGGTQNFPWRYMHLEGVRATVIESVRSIVNWVQLRASPRVRRAARESAVIVAANSTTADDFFRIHRRRCARICDVGISRVTAERRVAAGPRPLRILWSGVLEHRKTLSVLLHALAQLQADVDFELRILGTGPRRGAWQRLARKLGVDGRITWLNHLPHAQALEVYNWADVFAFTSLRDTTGTVVLEALGAGLPVVAFDHQGVGDVVTKDCGIKIPVEAPAKAIAGWARAISRLAADPELRERLGRGARDRARDYLWSCNGRRMADVYLRASEAAPTQAPSVMEYHLVRQAPSQP